MKTLIRFSLKRKFLNKSTLIFNLLIFTVIGCLAFADKIAEWIAPDSFDPLILYLSEDLYEDVDLFNEDDELYLLKEYQKEDLARREVKISRAEEGYEVISLYGLSEYEESVVRYALSSYQENVYFQTHDISSYLELEEVRNPVVSTKSIYTNDAMRADRQTFAFSVVTSLYFTSLSFCTAIATEVISEKSEKILEMILTAIRPREHFYAKLCAGWLSVLLQSGMSVSILLLWLSIRQGIDRGKGLLEFCRKTGLLKTDATTFRALFSSLAVDGSSFISMMILVLLFLLLGILFVQLVMTVLASYVQTVEEGAAVQTPCYVILMLTYYGALMLNNVYSLQDGAGRILSFVPFFSMLFMPMRIIMGVVSRYEIIISFVLSLSAILLVLDFGSPLYEKGLLNEKSGKKGDKAEKWQRFVKLMNTDIHLKKGK